MIRDLSDSALRALLALIQSDFQWTFREACWTSSGRFFLRAAVQKRSGLSSQGVRNGLTELESKGLVSVDRSGRSYEYRLELDVPTSCYTYVPASRIDEAQKRSGTELRLDLVLFRILWGWTDSSGDQLEHRRWKRLSLGKLAKRTGRSESALKEAIEASEGSLFERARPSSGAYYYRLLVGSTSSKKSKEEQSRAEIADLPGRLCQWAFVAAWLLLSNVLPPNRQKSAPPSFKERNRERKAQHARFKRNRKGSSGETRSPGGPGAMRRRPSQDRSSVKQHRSHQEKRSDSVSGLPAGRRQKASQNGSSVSVRVEDMNLTGFTNRLRVLGQTLADRGVWPRRIPRLLRKYSADRIQKNIALLRERGSQVQNTGAWLYAAITDGYALPSPEEDGESGSANGTGTETGLPNLEHRTKVTENEKMKYLRRGLASEEDFHRFKADVDPDQKQHIYFDPEVGGPTQKH